MSSFFCSPHSAFCYMLFALFSVSIIAPPHSKLLGVNCELSSAGKNLAKENLFEKYEKKSYSEWNLQVVSGLLGMAKYRKNVKKIRVKSRGCWREIQREIVEKQQKMTIIMVARRCCFWMQILEFSLFYSFLNTIMLLQLSSGIRRFSRVRSPFLRALLCVSFTERSLSISEKLTFSMVSSVDILCWIVWICGQDLCKHWTQCSAKLSWWDCCYCCVGRLREVRVGTGPSRVGKLNRK